MKSSLKKMLFVFALILAASLALATTALGATLCVDPGGAGGCYTTIGAAITAASPGDTITVNAGTYAENLLIDKALTINGPNAAVNPNTGVRAAEAVIVPAVSDPDPYNTCSTLVYITVDDVSLRGLTVDGDNTALTSGLNIGGADVDGCEGIASYEGIGGISIENNIIKNISYAAIDLYNYTDNSATSNNYIRYNLFEDIGSSTYGFGIGTLVYNNFYADITNNVYNNVRVGIQTGNFHRANVGPTGSISNNTINSWRLGIFHNLWYSDASVIPVANNTINAVSSTDSTKFYGMLLSSWGGTTNTTVTNNTINIGSISQPESGGYNVWNDTTSADLTISGGTVTGGDIGVFVNNWEGYSSNAGNTSIILDGLTIKDTAGASVFIFDSPNNTNGSSVFAEVKDSKLLNGDVGVVVSGADASATVSGNLISGHNNGALVQTSAAAEFSCNSFYNTSAYGLNNSTGVSVLAENNWWGDASGPTHASNPTGIGEAVSDDVDFDPWNTPTEGCSPATPDALTVTTSSPASGATLNASISALTVTFSEDVIADGGVDAANNTANYLLVEAGANTAFDTISCAGGSVADDVAQAIASAAYANGSGTGPYVATLTTAAPLAEGSYRLFVCGTTSIWSVAGAELNGGVSDTTIDFTIQAGGDTTTTTLPATGFPMGEATSLPAQPAEKAYASSDMVLAIPSLGIETGIVGVPQSAEGWDTTWLGQSAGYLHGSAFPTWEGNTVLTGHVWDNNNRPGPFAELKTLGYGEQIKIYAWGQVYTYEVRDSGLTTARNTGKVFQHEDYDWLTLVTCELYNPFNQSYLFRRVVRAVLVDISPQ